MKVATVVITFRPERAVIDKIMGYTHYMDFVIVADNTDTEDLSGAFARHTEGRLEYVGLMGNQGVATALNVAAGRALELGYTWLLMLDQDSVLREAAYVALKDLIEVQREADVGILSANQVSKGGELQQGAPRAEITEVDRLMTSGSVLNLQAYRRCGGFDEGLFIDHVDHEYCLRLQKAGYRTLQCSTIELEHSLGAARHATVFGRTVSYVEHMPFRLYYFTRNGLYVGARFFWFRPRFLAWVVVQMMKHLVKAVLFQDQKHLRLRMFYWGLMDFCIGRRGAGHVARSKFPR